MSGLDTIQPKRIAMCTPCDAGHWGSLKIIAEALLARGHQVIIYVADFHLHKFNSAFGEGLAFVSVRTSYPTEEDFLKDVRASGKTVFLTLRKALKEPVREALVARVKPHVVVADFMTVAAQEVAAELDIPLVINVQGPLALVAKIMALSDSSVMHEKRSLSDQFTKAMLADGRGAGEIFAIVREHIFNSLTIVNSFFGFDVARSLPANVRLTGPILPSNFVMTTEFVKKHPDLAEWLQKRGAAPTIYMSTGSMVALKDWQVKVLYEGVKLAGMRAVWSLKVPQQAQVPDLDDDDFYINSWLPQKEIMQSDHIVAVLGHCGWGCTVEALAAGKPVACLPFFADQPGNAQMLVDAGVAELVAPLPPFVQGIFNLYEPGDITAESVAAALMKITSESSYKDASLHLQRLSRTTDGATGAALEIEKVAEHGVSHLIAPQQQACHSGDMPKPDLPATQHWALSVLEQTAKEAAHAKEIAEAFQFEFTVITIRQTCEKTGLVRNGLIDYAVLERIFDMLHISGSQGNSAVVAAACKHIGVTNGKVELDAFLDWLFLRSPVATVQPERQDPGYKMHATEAQGMAMRASSKSLI